MDDLIEDILGVVLPAGRSELPPVQEFDPIEVSVCVDDITCACGHVYQEIISEVIYGRQGARAVLRQLWSLDWFLDHSERNLKDCPFKIITRTKTSTHCPSCLGTYLRGLGCVDALSSPIEPEKPTSE